MAGKSLSCRKRDEFIASLRGINGFVRAYKCPGSSPSEKLLFVIVPSLHSEEADEVIRLEVALISEAPDADVTIRIIGLNDLGISIDQLLERLPRGMEEVKLNQEAHVTATASHV